MLWDEGTGEPKGDPRAGLEKGHLSLVLHGKRLKGGWGLIRMRGGGKRENWLLVKENDAEARRNGTEGDILENLTSSVKSGRAMDEIADRKNLRELMERCPNVQRTTRAQQPQAT